MAGYLASVTRRPNTRTVLEKHSHPRHRTLRRRFFARVRAAACRCPRAFVCVHHVVDKTAFLGFRAYLRFRTMLTDRDPPPAPRAFAWRRFEFPYAMIACAAGTPAERLAPALVEARTREPGGKRPVTLPEPAVPSEAD